MATAGKSAAIAELADHFRNSAAAVLTEYRGLTVKQLTELRSSIRDHATYAVVKNTLTALAAKEAGVTAFEGQLVGPSAIAFITGDPMEAAKGLRDFARSNPVLVIKAGVLDGKPLTPDEIRQLADLESRDVLLAKLAGAMNASLIRAVYLFGAPLSQAARVVGALRSKVEAEGPADTTAAAAPAEAPPAEAPPADTTAADAPADADPASSPTPEPASNPGTASELTDVATGGDES